MWPLSSISKLKTNKCDLIRIQLLYRNLPKSFAVNNVCAESLGRIWCHLNDAPIKLEGNAEWNFSERNYCENMESLFQQNISQFEQIKQFYRLKNIEPEKKLRFFITPFAQFVKVKMLLYRMPICHGNSTYM